MQKKYLKERFVFSFTYVITDAVAIFFSFLLAYVIRRKADVVTSLDITEVPVLNFSFHEYISIVPYVTVLWVVIFIISGRYKKISERTAEEEFTSIFHGSTLGLFAMMILSFVIGKQLFSRLIIAYAWIISIGVLSVSRFFVHSIEAMFWQRKFGVKKIILAHLGKSGRQFLRSIRHGGWPGNVILGVFDNEYDGKQKKQLDSGPTITSDDNFIEGHQFLGTSAHIQKYLNDHEVDEMYIGLGMIRNKEIRSLMQSANSSGVAVQFIPDVFGHSASFKITHSIHGIPVLGTMRNQLSGSAFFIKRIFDIVVSVISLVILFPLLLFIALLVKLSSRGPIFYSQERIGRFGNPFNTYKFRSMRIENERKSKSTWTTKGDRRRTLIGAILRRTNLDELPQLMNIIKGDMSLVGPRPEQKQYVQEFEKLLPRYQDRHQVLPGLTGWAQINGWRGDTPIEERLQFDLYYIENWSFLFDIQIILKTVISLFFQKGAY